MKTLASTLTVLLALTAGTALPQSLPAYKDPSQPIETRVSDLLKRMTPEEKFRQIFMVPGDITLGEKRLEAGIFGLCPPTVNENADPAGQILGAARPGSAGQMAEGINEIQHFLLEKTRLGIPEIPFDEALHGLTRPGATRFPQSIGLAASFDTAMMHQVAAAIASETRSRGIRQVLSPVLNIARDVRWGRTEETYGEDPCLVSQMGVAFISEFEKQGVVATPKHFAVNVGDGGRDSYPIHLNERILEEIYFPAFRSAFDKAGAQSVMTAYNSLDGSPCTANDWLLNRKLKQEWGFRGFVISDACAVGGANVLHYTASGYPDAGQKAVENGLDVIFQTDLNHETLFNAPFLNGTVRAGAFDSAVSRVLRAKFRLGLFENPWADPAEAKRVNGMAAHRALALRAARESIVLLKNDSHLLPLDPKTKRIAVIGTDATEARPGGYSGPGNNPVSILQGIEATVSDSTEILFAPGCGRFSNTYETVPERCLSTIRDGQTMSGLTGVYFKNTTCSGSPAVERTDPRMDFHWTLYGPDTTLASDWFSARWTGKITADTTGTWKLGIEGNDGYRLWIDDKIVIDNSRKCSYGIHTEDVAFVKGVPRAFRLEYSECTGNGRLRLIWNAGLADSVEDAIGVAALMAEQADVAVVVAGIEEGEFRDRSSLKLPGAQEELIETVAATGTPVVVVLCGGSAVTMERWIDKTGAVLDAWYPGEAGGTAVAHVLFGGYNPAGRLPVTFPRSEGQLPLVYNHKPTGRGDDYLDGTGLPLFPFGYGLSYTTFAYCDLVVDPAIINPGDRTTVSFKVKNTGKTTGDEVCQLYLHDDLASVARPVSELKAFRRITLEPGETKSVSFILEPEDLSMPDLHLRRIIEPGRFTLRIGSSSADIRLKGLVEVK